MKNAVSSAARVLLVEDNAADVHLMRYALDAERFRYELTTLKDGAEALAFIRREGKYAHAKQPGLIVMDLHLPEADGLEILKEIRGKVECATLPVLVWSGSASLEERTAVTAFNACFITKPRNLDEFLEIGKKIKGLTLEGKQTREDRP